MRFQAILGVVWLRCRVLREELTAIARVALLDRSRQPQSALPGNPTWHGLLRHDLIGLHEQQPGI